jgi:hypothetical protein
LGLTGTQIFFLLQIEKDYCLVELNFEQSDECLSLQIVINVVYVYLMFFV